MIPSNAPPEENFIKLIEYADLKKIQDYIEKNPHMDLHYPNEDLDTPLTTAVNRGNLTILSAIVSRIDCDLDKTMTQACGKTALMHAAYTTKSPEILMNMIKHGADPSKIDIRGWNCLFHAIVGKRAANIVAILNIPGQGALIESRDFNGRTPLMISVYLSSYEIFKLLLEKGANVGVHDNLGFTALHVAVVRQKRDFVTRLMEFVDIDKVVTPYTNLTLKNLFYELMKDRMPLRRNDDDGTAQYLFFINHHFLELEALEQSQNHYFYNSFEEYDQFVQQSSN